MYAAYRKPPKDISPKTTGKKSPIAKDRRKMVKAGPSTLFTAPTQVRRSIGVIVAKIRPPSSTSPKAKSLPKQVATKYISRVTEAKAQVVKAKSAMNLSKNLKTEIDKDITEAIARLFSLLKEAEAVLKSTMDTEPVI